MEVKLASKDQNDKNIDLANQILVDQWSKWDAQNESIPDEMKDTHSLDMGTHMKEVDPGNISKEEYEESEGMCPEDLVGLDRVFMALWKAHMDTLKKKLKKS